MYENTNTGSTITGSDHKSPDGPDIITADWGADSIPLPDIADDNESARAIWISTDGLTRLEEGDKRQVRVPVALAVTDRRLLFLTKGNRGEPEEVYPVAYSDIAAIDIEDEMVNVTTTDATVWQISYPGTEPEIDTVLAHLRWVGELRARLIRCQSDIELAAGEVADYAYELDWEAAKSTYRRARERLDALICETQLIDPVAEQHLAPELTAIERRLEQGHARLYIERAKSALALGRHLIEGEEYERAREKLREAQQYYDRARDQSDAVKRGDAFQFGPQRELDEELENLSWEIETVAAEPIRQAHEAKIQAQFAETPAETLKQWELAYRRYGDVITLEWDDDGRQFAGDPAEVRSERKHAAEQIVELRETLAAEAWDSGARCQHDGAYQKALEHCLEAVDHLERVRELHDSVDSIEIPDIEQRLDRMQAVVTELREQEPPSRQDDSETTGPQPDENDTDADTETPADSQPSTATQSDTDTDGLPSIEELSDIDTHHEITLELEDPEFESGDSKEQDSSADEQQPATDDSDTETERQARNGTE